MWFSFEKFLGRFLYETSHGGSSTFRNQAGSYTTRGDVTLGFKAFPVVDSQDRHGLASRPDCDPPPSPVRPRATWQRSSGAAGHSLVGVARSAELVPAWPALEKSRMSPWQREGGGMNQREKPFRAWVSRHEVALYLVLAYAISWSIWPLVLLNPESSPLVPFGPGLAAVLVAFMAGGRRELMELLRQLGDGGSTQGGTALPWVCRWRSQPPPSGRPQ